MSDMEIIQARFRESIETKNRLLQDESLLNMMLILSDAIVDAIRSGGKLLICGNGGSASDASHIAGEIVGRFQKERKGYAAISLSADVATMTSIANDYGYEDVFARQVEGLMSRNDILLGISTSGNSLNIIKAFKKVKETGGKTALLSGKGGGELKNLADYAIIIPSDATARIQEAHLCIYHILCELIEVGLTGNDE